MSISVLLLPASVLFSARHSIYSILFLAYSLRQGCEASKIKGKGYNFNHVASGNLGTHAMATVSASNDPRQEIEQFLQKGMCGSWSSLFIRMAQQRPVNMTISHLCGKWARVNPTHHIWESLVANMSRKPCHNGNQIRSCGTHLTNAILH